MKHTGTQETATGTVSASIEVEFEVPRKGDTLYIYGHRHTLGEDMTPRIECTYDGEQYQGEIMRTKEGTNRVVFIGDGLTWREGEAFIKA